MTTVIDTAVLDVLASPKVVEAVEQLIAARRQALAVLREPGQAIGADGRDRAQRRFLAESKAREALDAIQAAIDRNATDIVRNEVDQ